MRSLLGNGIKKLKPARITRTGVVRLEHEGSSLKGFAATATLARLGIRNLETAPR
jgi:hypothetical protein